MARKSGQSGEVTPESVPVIAYKYRRVPTSTGLLHDLYVGIDGGDFYPVRDATEATVAMLAAALDSVRHKVTLYRVVGEEDVRVLIEFRRE